MSPLQALWMVQDQELSYSVKKRNSESLLKGKDCWKKKSVTPNTEGGIRSAPDIQQENKTWVLCVTFFLRHFN